MRTAIAATVLVLSSGALWLGLAQAQAPVAAVAPPQRVQVAPPAANVNAILMQIQQATRSAGSDIGKLRIEKWKTDADQRQQLQQVAESVQKNIRNAVPGLIDDVQSSRGSVLASFKLYHNLNVLYEYLSSLADAAGVLGKREEYEPLAADSEALDTARQNLSTYIEQAAGRLETISRPPGPVQSRPNPAVSPTPRKVIVIDDNDEPVKKPVKPSKKKTSAPSATPAPPAASSPH